MSASNEDPDSQEKFKPPSEIGITLAQPNITHISLITRPAEYAQAKVQ